MRGTFYYVPGTFCDNTQVNFTVRSNVTFSSCLWISNNSLSYQNASDKCRALGASMYTIKVKEKLDILIDAAQEYTAALYPWVGLDDIQQENVFRWSDDNSILNVSWTIWQKDEPNNEGNQDCVYYSFSRQLLNDWHCNGSLNYVCEMIPSFT
ncbi:CD209 antigen-like protein 2 [Biomphalaria pfeifferi]|uniref:CD209 antigen-like protein 2 n=1 Tax=Biomphalaria pfeifferi TaxID=112525 RepID=A0AAD8FI79_BIOPF|nr:CD209 antigen-like protein 2 [Biomphalaria pfeifferi]